MFPGIRRPPQRPWAKEPIPEIARPELPAPRNSTVDDGMNHRRLDMREPRLVLQARVPVQLQITPMLIGDLFPVAPASTDTRLRRRPSPSPMTRAALPPTALPPLFKRPGLSQSPALLGSDPADLASPDVGVLAYERVWRARNQGLIRLRWKCSEKATIVAVEYDQLGVAASNEGSGIQPALRSGGSEFLPTEYGM